MRRNSSRLIQANRDSGRRGARIDARARGPADTSLRHRYGRPAPRPLMKRARTGLLALALVTLAAVLGAEPAAAAARTSPAKPAPELARIRFWTAPDHTRLVFDFTARPGDPTFRMADSLTFEVYLAGARKSPAITTEFVGDSLVTDIFTAASDTGTVIRIRLKKTTTPLGFVLAPGDGQPDRVVVDIPAPPDPEAEKALAQKVEELKKSRKLIIAIDAGHGGDDPGAIGHHRLQEADITLAIAKKLKAELDQIPGFSAVLTRTDDYFIPLRKRIDLARRYQADLFVSIHCNASRDHDATGTEVYFLSLTGATDEASRSVAEKENAADLIGGVPPETGSDLLSILFDLRQNDTIRRSSELAEILIDNLERDSRLQTRGVKQAGFVVLKAPEIPSVLVETAFITNAREAAMLKDPQFQRKFAEMLADGLQAFKSQRDKSLGGMTN
jgi:N-acetylmuramoyl-L-alanine amidase